jgi:hypothetical protein
MGEGGRDRAAGRRRRQADDRAARRAGAAVPLGLRVGALAVTLAIMLFDRRRVMLAVLAGEATLIAGAWLLI